MFLFETNLGSVLMEFSACCRNVPFILPFIQDTVSSSFLDVLIGDVLPLLAVLTHKYNQKQVMSKCMNCLMVYDLKENYTDQIYICIYNSHLLNEILRKTYADYRPISQYLADAV